ncbi:hypothetical protein Taro_023595, partial [Colocasia esculenta]|nr:hypothetical protein [Colocasia esculenta]
MYMDVDDRVFVPPSDVYMGNMPLRMSSVRPEDLEQEPRRMSFYDTRGLEYVPRRMSFCDTGGLKHMSRRMSFYDTGGLKHMPRRGSRNNLWRLYGASAGGPGHGDKAPMGVDTSLDPCTGHMCNFTCMHNLLPPGGPLCNFTQTGSRTGVFIRRTNGSSPSQRRGTSPEGLRERILERQTASGFAGTQKHLANVGEEESLRRGSLRESLAPLEVGGFCNGGFVGGIPAGVFGLERRGRARAPRQRGREAPTGGGARTGGGEHWRGCACEWANRRGCGTPPGLAGVQHPDEPTGVRHPAKPAGVRPPPGPAGVRTPPNAAPRRTGGGATPARNRRGYA